MPIKTEHLSRADCVGHMRAALALGITSMQQPGACGRIGYRSFRGVWTGRTVINRDGEEERVYGTVITPNLIGVCLSDATSLEYRGANFKYLLKLGVVTTDDDDWFIAVHQAYFERDEPRLRALLDADTR